MSFVYSSIINFSDVANTITFYEKAFGFSGKKFIIPEDDYGELNTA